MLDRRSLKGQLMLLVAATEANAVGGVSTPLHLGHARACELLLPIVRDRLPPLCVV